MSRREPSLIRVVIVDDDPMVRMVLTLTLRSTDEIDAVGEAEDGEEVLLRQDTAD
jgi:DNA-binding NarL/FixJ family response regulator